MDVVTMEYDRLVHAPIDTSRRTVLDALRELSFKIDQSEGAVIQAHRGSFKGARFGGDSRIRVSVTVTGSENDEARVHVRLGDAEHVAPTEDEVQYVYGPVFARVEEDLDAWLRALDPRLELDGAPTTAYHPEHRPTLKEHFGGLVRHLPGSMGKHAADAVLGDVHLWVMAPDAAGVLEPDQAQTCLAVAALVCANPGPLPGPLRAQIGDLTIALRNAITDARPPAGRLDIAPRDKRAVDFLFQQARIRETLPVREVYRCRDCGAERVVNPTYQQRLATNKALQNATGLMGVTVGSAGVNVFVVVGKLLNLSALTPPTPCRRCEGIDADVSLATICPKCHEIRREAVLTTCPQRGCAYDFRARAAGVSLWRTAPQQEAAVAASPAGWYPDPAGRHRLRWFDRDWTAWAADDGPVVDDPLDRPESKETT